MDALARIRRTDVAMTVLNQTTYPGFGSEISQGATTDWDEWTYSSDKESHDRAMFSGMSVPLFGGDAGSVRAGRGAARLGVHDGIAEYSVGSGHWNFTSPR